MDVLEVAADLQRIRLLSAEAVHAEYNWTIPSERQISHSFWENYNAEQAVIGLRACLLLWVVTAGKVVPREFQLQATLALLSGQDCLVDVGTGYGKTLCLILPCLLKPNDLSMIVSPLKRLQAVQVTEFERYGIKTVAINEDTPSDTKLWQDISKGVYTALIVQPEQLFMNNGHLSRLARLIALPKSRFARLIKILHVDEAHFIYSAGQEHYSLPAFRPAWFRLGELRIKLRKDLVVQALSGTQPPHIKRAIIKSLLFDDTTLCSIELSSNRPNMAYATHPIVGELSDYRNLEFLVPVPFPDGYTLPKTLVFHDSIAGAIGATHYLVDRLPLHLAKSGAVKQYHSLMSKEYLSKTYDMFQQPGSSCRILHATEGASTGLDVPDIDVVVQYGIPRDVPTALQRGGRGGRNSISDALFLIMYEPWVLKIVLDEANIDFTADPDHPNVSQLTIRSNKQERTGGAMIYILQSVEICIRDLFAKYLADKSLDARLFTSTHGCCDRHPDTYFHIRDYFKGRLLYSDGTNIYYGDIDEIDRRQVIATGKGLKRKAPVRTRPTKDRKILCERLHSWRYTAWLNGPSATVRPLTSIVDDKDIIRLSKLDPDSITTSASIVLALKETEEWSTVWASGILTTIRNYDLELAESKRVARELKNKDKADGINHAMRISFEEESRRLEEEIRNRVKERFAAGNSVRLPLQPISVNLPPRPVEPLLQPKPLAPLVQSAPRRSARAKQQKKI